MANTRREKYLRQGAEIRGLHDKGYTREEIVALTGYGIARVRNALRFVEEKRPCRRNPEPHHSDNHAECRKEDLHMNYEEPEEFPK